MTSPEKYIKYSNEVMSISTVYHVHNWDDSNYISTCQKLTHLRVRWHVKELQEIKKYYEQYYRTYY